MTTAKRPQGRPAVSDAERLLVATVRLNAAQIAKLKALGGSEWLRDRIDRAKVKSA
jgi:hypothetical protein